MKTTALWQSKTCKRFPYLLITTDMQILQIAARVQPVMSTSAGLLLKRFFLASRKVPSRVFVQKNNLFLRILFAFPIKILYESFVHNRSRSIRSRRTTQTRRSTQTRSVLCMLSFHRGSCCSINIATSFAALNFHKEVSDVYFNFPLRPPFFSAPSLSTRSLFC